jgi:hypothetical protein
MRTRLPLLRLAALTFGLTLALLPNFAFAAPAPMADAIPGDDVCRRLHAAGLDHRRCHPHRPPVDPIAYCRRVWGTDEWTRRCLQLDDFDPIAYCRRIWGTDLWTRRCLHLSDDPLRPVDETAAEPPRPAVEPVQPSADLAEPVGDIESTQFVSSEPGARPERPEQPARPNR